jgi:NAD-dependent SIR2 family protein deacetylase
MVMTIPNRNGFTVKCLHCNRDTNKEPLNILLGKEMELYSCPDCKELTLVRDDDGYSTSFKVEG